MKHRVWRGPDARLLMERRGVSDPVVAITEVAQELLDDLGLTEPPFRTDMIASYVGVREIRRKPMRQAARLVPEAGSLIIEVNADHPRGKQNFSVNHEVIHTQLPTYSGEVVEDETTGDFSDSLEEESLCDIGAAALLLDSRRLGPIATDLGPSVDTLFECSEMFDASIEATARALAALDLWSCAFVFWEEGYRQAERIPAGQTLLPLRAADLPASKFRVKRAYVAPSLGWFIPWNKSVPSTSSIARCSSSETFTTAVEQIDLGFGDVEVRCLSRFAPYMADSIHHPRVISMLLPTQPVRRHLPEPRASRLPTL